MDYFLSSIYMILLLCGIGHAALSPQEIYWKSVLPNVLMPSAISDLLPDKREGTPSTKVIHAPRQTYYYGDVIQRGWSPRYDSNANGNQVGNDPNAALFFLEKNMYPGAKMKVGFTKSQSSATFVPRQKADMVPFSSYKIPQILEQFSIAPESEEAMRIKKTIGDCEAPAFAEEKKYCATSLESMVEFSMSSLGTNNIKVSSTIVSKEDNEPQSYTIMTVRSKKMTGNIMVACHQEDYVYAVFYCHYITSTKAYTIDMTGADGNKVKAVAICHTNTKEWNPNHVSFKVLKVKPGTLPICHFMPLDNVVWSS